MSSPATQGASSSSQTANKKRSTKSRSSSKSKTKKSSGTGSTHRSSSKSKSHGKSKDKSKRGSSKHSSRTSSKKDKVRTSSSGAKKRSDSTTTTTRVAKVKPQATVLTPVTTPAEPIKMTFLEDKTKSNGVKTEMRRAPFRALLKQMIREEQKNFPSLKGKDVRMNRDVPKAIQAEIENWSRDQFKLMAIAARHATRNTINPEDVAYVKCLNHYSRGSVDELTKLKSESAKNAAHRMAERQRKKKEKEEKEAEDKKNGIVKEPKAKRERKSGGTKVDAVAQQVAEKSAEIPPLTA